VQLAAVYAPVRARAEQFAARHGGAAFDSLDQLLASRPLDVAIIGTPSGVHAEHGIAAAANGLHVLVEKPIEVTTARADALIHAAARAGVTPIIQPGGSMRDQMILDTSHRPRLAMLFTCRRHFKH